MGLLDGDAYVSVMDPAYKPVDQRRAAMAGLLRGLLDVSPVGLLDVAKTAGAAFGNPGLARAPNPTDYAAGLLGLQRPQATAFSPAENAQRAYDFGSAVAPVAASVGGLAANSLRSKPMSQLNFGPVPGQTAESISDAERSRRMAEQGYTRGYWRGGAKVADGPYYSPDKSAADAFAARHGPSADVREYALRVNAPFQFHAQQSPETIAKVANVLATEYENPKAAKELMAAAREYKGGMPGSLLVQFLDQQTGSFQGPLRSAGFDALDAGQEMVVFSLGNVRDANRAMFDPSKVGKYGPFLGVAAPGVYGLPAGQNDFSVK